LALLIGVSSVDRLHFVDSGHREVPIAGAGGEEVVGSFLEKFRKHECFVDRFPGEWGTKCRGDGWFDRERATNGATLRDIDKASLINDPC
jgi:hypothetical protein